MKIYWTGTDALCLVEYPPFIRFRYKCKIFVMRIVARLMDYFADEHYIDSEFLRKHLVKFGMKKPIRVVELPLKHTKPYKKVKHKGFNILFYKPPKIKSNFRAWVYSYDIFEKVKERIKNVNWMIVDGSQDLKKIFPIVDFYLRCNRHDGSSRLRRECEIQKIPYYHSQENPDIKNIIRIIKKYKYLKARKLQF